MAVAPKWTRHKKRAFLKALRHTGVVTSAAEAVGLSRSSAYQLRKADDAFRQAWDDAIQAALDELELELRRRAMHGVEQPVYYGGKECGRIRTYNDNLGMFLLRVRRGVIPDEAQAEATAASAEHPAADPEGPSPREVIEARLRRMGEQEAPEGEAPRGETNREDLASGEFLRPGSAGDGSAGDGSAGDGSAGERSQ